MLLAINPQYVGITAGVFTALSLVPQLTKMLKEKKGQDISLYMLGVLLVGLILWLIYGIMIEDWPIIITNSFSLLVNCIIVILDLKYKKEGKV